MGELVNLNPKSAITDADISQDIARDTEITAAINAHIAATDPHTQYPQYKTITFTTPSSAGGTAQTYHNLDTSKILSFSAIVNAGNGFIIPPDCRSISGYIYSIYIYATQIRCFLATSGSNNIYNKEIAVTFLVLP